MNLDHATCEYGDPRCGEGAYDVCFDCEDPVCEEHAPLVPGNDVLRVCPACLEKRRVRSLMEDSGYSRSEATALVDAGFSELEEVA